MTLVRGSCVIEFIFVRLLKMYISYFYKPRPSLKAAYALLLLTHLDRYKMAAILQTIF